MRWKPVVAAAVAAAVAVAIVVYFAAQPPEETPYAECRPGVVSAACVEASKMNEQCRSGSYKRWGERTCRRVLELDQWCGDHLRRADAASCRMSGFHFVHCITAGGGSLPCYLVEMKFVSCLQTGASDFAGCRQQHAEGMVCMALAGMTSKRPSCKEVIDDIEKSPKPTSWRDPSPRPRRPR